MGKRLMDIARTLVVLASVVILTACTQGAPETEADQTAPAVEQPVEEIRLTSPVPTSDRVASGKWTVFQGPTTLKMWDGATNEEMEFQEIKNIKRFFDIKEYDDERGDHDWPDQLHVTLADGTEGDITDADMINDLWYRIIGMRLSPDLAMADLDTLYTNEFVFSWADGRTQTFTFKGHTALAVDGTLFPIIEDYYSNGEIFNGLTVTRMPNSFFPDTALDFARTVIEESLGKREVFFIKDGTTLMSYSEEFFEWDAAGDGTYETYTVKPIKGASKNPSGIRVTTVLVDNPPSCVIEDATRIYLVEMKQDDSGYTYPEITYQPEDSKDRKDSAKCTIKLEDGELVVTYL